MLAARPEHSPALDGLRGVAALMVVASHAGNMNLHLLPGFSWAGAGKNGVFLFFVISAYLLTAQWLVQGQATGRALDIGFKAFHRTGTLAVAGWGGQGDFIAQKRQ